VDEPTFLFNFSHVAGKEVQPEG